MEPTVEGSGPPPGTKSGSSSAGPIFHNGLTGRTIDNFVVEKQLGAGGFGEVYRARDAKLDRAVALKFLRDSGDEQHSRLFEREAKAIARLSKHPHIVEIFSWGEYEGQHYFALEYVPHSLERVLERNPRGLPLLTALEIAHQCAEGLAFAHEAGVVHRDIKPANILLETDRGPAKIADFGLTRFVDSVEQTLIGGISGSPPYMSPEQASGLGLDHRTDLFSLGVTLYEMLCGSRPFEGGTPYELMDRIRNNQSTPLKDRGEFPDAVLRVVAKATAHDRDKRYATAKEFAADLDRALTGLDSDRFPTERITGHPSRPARLGSRAGIAAACVVGALALAGLALTYTQRDAAESPVDQATVGGELVGQGASAARAVYERVHAFLDAGQLGEAEAAIAQMPPGPQRAEGEAALLARRDGASALPALETLRAAHPTPYMHAQVARVLNAAGDYDEAARAAEQAREQAFAFDWQQREWLETLGRAYYHLGRFDEASEAFDQLRASGRESATATADAFQRLIAARTDRERRSEVLERARAIRERMEARAATAAREPADAWSSRPLTFFVLPVAPDDARVLAEQGATDILPVLVAESLDRAPGLQLLDRAIIHEVLAELQLSADASSAADPLRLGRVLGARLILRLEAGEVAGQPLVRLSAVDVETTDVVPVERLQLSGGETPGALAAQLAENALAALREAYPLRGIVAADGQGRVTLNLGEDTGVAEGMAFALTPVEDTLYRLEGPRAVVTGVSEQQALVRLEGVEAEQLPQQGLYAFRTSDAASG
jgi:tetratricopeptide (TPR) repeat protein